jgi:hypothetical protein
MQELALMRVVDREQAKLVGGFGSTTRVNVRLLKLTRAGLLKRFFLGTSASGRKALYTLSQKGATLVQVPKRGPRHRSEESIAADFFIEHQLAVNEIYCGLRYHRRLPEGIFPASFRGFFQPITPGLRLIPDGYAVLNTPSGVIAAFLEVDLGNERLSVWREKVRSYLHLATSGTFEKEFQEHRFRVLVIANSDGRMRSIRKAVLPLSQKVFWFTTLNSIRESGLCNALWVRPPGNAQPFLEALR